MRNAATTATPDHISSSLDMLPFGIGPHIADILHLLAVLVDLTGVTVVLVGFAICLGRLIGRLAHGAGFRRDLADLRPVQASLATYILTGLEFMIASDIVMTVLSRHVNDLLYVGVLVAIRTAISYSLARETNADQHSS